MILHLLIQRIADEAGLEMNANLAGTEAPSKVGTDGGGGGSFGKTVEGVDVVMYGNVC
jgi:hypothetical protein